MQRVFLKGAPEDERILCICSVFAALRRPCSPQSTPATFVGIVSKISHTA